MMAATAARVFGSRSVTSVTGFTERKRLSGRITSV